MESFPCLLNFSSLIWAFLSPSLEALCIVIKTKSPFTPPYKHPSAYMGPSRWSRMSFHLSILSLVLSGQEDSRHSQPWGLGCEHLWGHHSVYHRWQGDRWMVAVVLCWQVHLLLCLPVESHSPLPSDMQDQNRTSVFWFKIKCSFRHRTHCLSTLAFSLADSPFLYR